MNLRSPSGFFFPFLCFSFALIILLHFDHVSSTPEVFYQTCGNTFSCGNITGVEYPFRGYSDPEYCGYPGLVLRCDQGNNITRIEIKNMTYRVLAVHPTNQTMRVAREDVMEASCPTDLTNTTLDYTLFDYATSYVNLTFLYGCPAVNLPGLNLLSTCGSNGGNSVYVLPGHVGPGRCNVSVVYPIVQTGTGGSVNYTGLDQVLREGFDI